MLTGDRKGTWSLYVTRNQRLTFRMDDAQSEVCDLNLEDYH
jgi:proteic killer suppression protein